MKKIIALMLVLCMAFAMVACGGEKFDPSAKSEGVMTYAQYDAAALETEVTIEGYVQATQSWYKDAIKIYLQDPDGGYFVYDVACTEADAAKLEKGTKIQVKGVKSAWEGEVEVVDGTFTFVESEKWVAEATDVTSLLANETELIKHQNKFVSFKGLTIDSVEYKNGEPGDDIYVNVSKDGATYSFCVEVYLTGPDTDVYKAFADLKAGDVVDMEGFLYWYKGVNTHITAVSKAG